MAIRAQKPLALTMGEPAGIGPELIARIWRDKVAASLPPVVYIGSVDALRAVDPDLPIRVLDETALENDAAHQSNEKLSVIEVATNAPIICGELDAANGKSVIASIDKAVKMAQDGLVSGVVTAPIHKAGLYNAGFDAPGHTEYLARLCDLADDQSVMMLAVEGLRVVPVTVHVPLKDVHTKLTADKIIHAGLVTAHDLRNRFGVERPRIAIAGLNPHAGESGTIGMEEATHIMPAVWALRDHGVDVTDPMPADTLFHVEARKNFDAALCMYHDQALIPVKTIDFWGGVNITLGLPIIRTSPDHGTALEIAGNGIARTDSMLAAIHTAKRMATFCNARASS